MRHTQLLNAIKHPLLLALLLLFGESCFGFVGAQAQAKPPGFPDGQTQPKPGPITSGTVTLWQLPDDAKAIIQADSGDLYGIYYSAWSNPSNQLPGVSDSKWINEDNPYFPWKGNKDLAKELSSKYQLLKDDLLVKSCSIQDQSGSNNTCVDGVENLYLYGYWNGGGFAYGSGEDAAKRPTGTPDSKFINYYWNGEVYRTIASNPSYRIQAFAGCKVGAGQTISAGKSVSVSKLGAGDQDCYGEDFVAPIFTGGELVAGESADNVLGQDFYVTYGTSNNFANAGGLINNNEKALAFNGSFSSLGAGSYGNLAFTGSGTTTLKDQVSLRGNLLLQEGVLNVDASNVISATPLIFEDGDNTLTVAENSVMRVTGDDLVIGYGPRKPGDGNAVPINDLDSFGKGNHRASVIAFGDGKNILQIDQGGLLVASYVGMLPSEFSGKDGYSQRCKEGQPEVSCYRSIPQIEFGKGNDSIINKGVVVGPGEASTGNALDIKLGNGDDTVLNEGYLGCLTSGADAGGYNGFKGQNTCADASSEVNDVLPEDSDLSRNYNVNLKFEGGNDLLVNRGYVRGSVNMAGGDDTIVSSGGLRGPITLGKGSDELTLQADGEWSGSGVVDDWIALGSKRESDSGDVDDLNKVTLVGPAVVAYRNSLGFGSASCGTTKNPGGYGCRWENSAAGAGFSYIAITGSQGADQIVVRGNGRSAKPAEIWGKVEFGPGNDSLSVESTGSLSAYGDLDFGSGDDRLVNYGAIALPSGSNVGSKLLQSGSILMGDGNDVVITNSNISGAGYIDGGSRSGDVDEVVFGSTGDVINEFKVNKIRNFERASQRSGSWDYDGDYAAAGIGTMTIEGGIMRLTDSGRSIFQDVVMTGGVIFADISDKDSAPLKARSFVYTPTEGKDPGQLVIQAGSTTDPEGTYLILDVPETSQSEMNELAANATLNYDGEVGEFSGLGDANGIPGTANFDVYLVEGSLNVQVDAKPASELIDGLDDLDPSEPDLGLDQAEQDLVEIIQDGGAGSETVDEILDDVLENIDLPIISYGTLAKLIVSGLAPRNIDGAGRGMATYNNLLTDVVFERLPLRQFDPVVVQETVVEQEEVMEESAPPVRGLWSKSGELSDQQAQQALDQAIAQAEVTGETTIESLEASGFIEDTSLTAQYARRAGVRAWFRGFGGDDNDSYNDNFYNPYYVNAGGGVLGVDVSVTDNFQIGAFANYGNINLIQQNALAGGGSWNSDGWGGGVKANYWSDNFYIQGLFSATGFSGNQKREIIEITDQLGDDTASGDKSATSYGLAFRVGAPFEAGKFVLEPQFTTTWSFNNEHQFTESGAGQLNLTYKERSTTYVQTDLAMKFSYPINTGETSQLVPSLRVGWLGDWSGNLSDQTLGYRFTNKEATIKSANKDTNGVLVEGGLDYTIANVNSSSYKVYLRGGIEAWGGARGTDYRASGGFEWQF